MSFDYDLFVIGAGSGGVRAGRMSAQFGARVAIAEGSRVGGTCVIRGCVPKKLMVFASAYPDTMDDAKLMELAAPFLEATKGAPLTPAESGRIQRALPALKPRAKTLVELARVAAWLLPDVPPLQITGKPGKPFRREGVGALLSALTSRLEGLEDADWTSPSLHTLLEDFVAEHAIGFGTIGQPVRSAMTRGLPSPDLSDVLAILGPELTTARLHEAVALINESET